MNVVHRIQVLPFLVGVRRLLVSLVVLATMAGSTTTSSASTSAARSTGTSHPSRSQIFLQQEQGHWQLTWNDWTATARSGVASQGPLGSRVDASRALRNAQRFVDRHATALGSELAQLRLVRHRFSGETWLSTWEQEVDGVRVVGAFVDVTSRSDGVVMAFRSSLRPNLSILAGNGTAAGSEQISRKTLGPQLDIESSRPCIVVPATAIDGIPADEIILSNVFGGRWRLRVSRVDGTVLTQENLVRTQSITGTVSGRISPMYFQDPQVEVNLPWLQVFESSDSEGPSTFSDRNGFFDLSAAVGSHELHADLAGRYVKVTNQAGDPTPHVIQQAQSPSSTDLIFNAVNSRPDERTIYFHTNHAHDQFKDRFGFDLLDFPVPAIAHARDPNSGDPNFPNAYWNGLVLGFGNGGGTFFNMGQHVDVIYHEYTHAVTDYIYRPVGGLNGVIGASMHEGLSDYFSASFTDDPLLGDHLLRDRTEYLRRIDNLRVFPDHLDTGFRPDVHANGVILAGALWDLRKRVGADVADRLAHHARELLPLDYESYFAAVLLQDDVLYGDAIPGNGSPHHTEILQAFGRHGLGPMGAGSLSILHVPLSDSEDPTSPRQVRARMSIVQEGADRAMRLLWSTGDTFTGIWMQAEEDGSFVGSIPAQPQGTQVRYYITAVQLPPVVTAALPASAPEQVFEYRVESDTQPPTIAHVAVGQHAAFTGAPRIQATLSDNGGIHNAWLEYRFDNGSEGLAGLVRENPLSQVFKGALPVPLAAGRSFQYRIHAIDTAADAHHTISPQSGWHEMNIVEDLIIDFEPDDGGWSHNALLIDRADEWSLSAANNHTGGGSQSWHCQTATAPGQTVASALTTPSYRLGEAATASIWSWIRAAQNGNGAVDAGQVQIQVDQGDWQILTPTEGYSHEIDRFLLTSYLPPQAPCLSGNDVDWRQLTFDLAPYVGTSVRLRFLFAGAQPVSQETSEWFLDDFSLQPGTRLPTDTAPPGAASVFLLRQPPSPNPFNPSVEFVLEAKKDLEAVRLEIHDATGRRTCRLLDGPMRKGILRTVWDGKNAQGLASASGVYYYRLESGLGRQSGKLVLVR